MDADLRRPAGGPVSLALGGPDDPGLVDLRSSTRVSPWSALSGRGRHSTSRWSRPDIFRRARTRCSSRRASASSSRKLADDYDYVVVDAPPLCSVQDCRIIAHWVDGFLLVVAAHRTPRRLVDEALERCGARQDARLRLQWGRPAVLELLRLLRSERLDATGLVQRLTAGVGRAVTRVGQMLRHRRWRWAVSLILVEGATLFAAVATTVFLWGSPHSAGLARRGEPPGSGGGALPLLHRGLLLQRPLRPAGSCGASAEFATRLLQGWASPCCCSPVSTRSSRTCGWVTARSSSSLLVIVGLLLPIRAVGYAVMRAPCLRPTACSSWARVRWRGSSSRRSKPGRTIATRSWA